MENSKEENIIVSWFMWHFFQMPKFLIMVWKNYISFSLDFFSAPLLLKTLFSPWRKYHWHYPKGFAFGEYLNIFISNIFSRIIGAICRIMLVILSVVVVAFIFTAGFMVIVLWILAPLGLISLFFFF